MVKLDTAEQRPNLHYDLIDPEAGINYGCPAKGWRYDRSSMARLIDEKWILWPLTPQGRPRKKQLLAEPDSPYTGFSSIVGEGCFTRFGTKEPRAIFGSQVFNVTKCTELISELVEQATAKNNAILLDGFAESGTTAHAALNLNKADGLNRRSILIEMSDYADSITAERVRHATWDYGEGGNAVESVDSGFSFYNLGPALFRADGPIDPSVTYDDLERYAWATETHAPYSNRTGEHRFLLNENARTVYYLIWKPGEETAAKGPRRGRPLCQDVHAGTGRRDRLRHLYEHRRTTPGKDGVSRHHDKLDGVPIVCVKVPTGGGKTLVGTCAAGVLTKALPSHNDVIV